MRHVVTLVGQGTLLLLVTLGLQRLETLPDSVLPFIRVYPYTVFATGLFVAWFFARSRILFALLILAVADRALLQFSAGDAAAGDLGRTVFNAVALLLPLNLVAFAIITDRGLLSLRSLVHMAPLPLQILLVAWVCRPDQRELAAWLAYSIVDAQFVTWIHLPLPALVAFGLAFVLQVVRVFRYATPIETGFLWTVIATFLALSGGGAGEHSTIYFATAGLILVVSMLQISHRMAYYDELTDLPGRRALIEKLVRTGRRYAVALVDIDHFKQVNDVYGHDVGDQVLRMVAAKIDWVTGGGKAFRYGGEEFAVLFTGKPLHEIRRHLEALRKTIEATPFVLRSPNRPEEKPDEPIVSEEPRTVLSITVSIGVAEWSEHREDHGEVIKAADKALYRAKEEGRNRVRT